MHRARIWVVLALLASQVAWSPSAFGVELLGGPMPGHTTDSSVRVWARSKAEAEMVLLVSRSPDLSKPLRSAPVNLLAEDDFAGIAEVRGLAPLTRYYYNLLLDGEEKLEAPLPSLRTFPPEGKPARVRVLFGGGIRFQVEPEQVIWNAMRKQEANVFISMGDNVYPDPWNPIRNDKYFRELDLGGNEKLMRKNKEGAYAGIGPGYLYHRVYHRIQQSIPSFRYFCARTPTYALWDDHDAYHDGTGGAKIPMQLRLESIKVFKENFANPYYGGGDKAPGIWCHFALADLEFFLLDARTYRDYAKKKERRFLGEAEEKWLKGRLLESKATFKFLVCGSPWNNQPKGGKKLTEDNYYDKAGDTLASFKWHRDELFKWVIKHRIPGMVLLSGDRHRAEVVKVWPSGQEQFVFYDLNNCNIASRTHGAAGEPGEDGLIYCYVGRCFGVLDIDTTRSPATLTYSIWGSRRGRPPFQKQYEFVLEASDFLPRPSRQSSADSRF